ncbi:hypothetical protein ACFQ3N_02595 [Virgibacillus byunsanensis]|uniref:Uncharacterized protein n=1 Tax=Virgibacillus byunsanensis TaxID=570945 RepID=A0ABW3LJB5_9BACI
MQLQRFVTEVFEELGGVVIPVEYALCHVLVPEAYTPYFQNKTELELAFDFEVSQEHPESEFVTFGSFVLEQLLAIVHQNANSTLRFAEIERLELGNPLKKITRYLENEPGKITIVGERPVLGLWAVFQYNITYVADEKTQDSEQIWVNLLTNEICPEMKRKQNWIIYKQESLYTYPIPETVEMSYAFEKATKYVKNKAEQQKNIQSNHTILEKDVERIANYYKELLAENKKRVSRKGLSDDKKKELATKSETITLERDKQLQEIYNKYNAQIEMNIDNGILYFIPLLEYNVEIQFRANIKQKTLFYNPITKDFFKKDTSVSVDAVQTTGSIGNN